MTEAELLKFRQIQHGVMTSGIQTKDRVWNLFRNFLDFVDTLAGSQTFAVTFRQKAGSFDKFLRPALMYPGEIGAHFIKPEGWATTNFSIQELEGGEPISLGHCTVHLACYGFSDLEGSDPKQKFKSRAWDNLQRWRTGKVDFENAEEKEEFSSAAQKNGFCLIFAICEGDSKEIRDLIAVYSSAENTLELSRHARSLAEAACVTVERLDQLEMDSKSKLHAEKQKLHIRLANEINSAEIITPATTVTEFCAETKRLLESDCFFGSNFIEVSFKDRCPKVKSQISIWFVNITFTSTNGKYRPGFKLYPRNVAFDYKKAAYRINSESEPTLVELLADDWIKDEKILHPTIEDEPSIRNLSDDAICREPMLLLRQSTHTELGFIEHLNAGIYGIQRMAYLKDGKITGHLCTKTVVEEGKTDLWASLNCDVSDKQKAHTVASFLLFPDSAPRNINFPSASIVLESLLPDALSAEDFSIISQFAEVLEVVLGSLHLSKLQASFVEKARQASGKSDTTSVFNGITFGEIIFELSRVDYRWIREFDLSDIANPVRKEAATALSEFLANNSFPVEENGVGSAADIASGRKKAAGTRLKWIRSNKPKIIDFFNSLHQSQLADEAHGFLRACPSNVLWHCYASAAQRALAHRDLNESFSLQTIQPGYSATTMFVLSNGHEVRQVIKFGPEEAIKSEQKNYKTFVRYRILNAARIAREAVAYESTGSITSPETYGVIVSDLIGGFTEGPHNLPWSLHERTNLQHKKTTAESCKGIVNLFKDQLALWTAEQFSGPKPPKSEPLVFVKNKTRVGVEETFWQGLSKDLGNWFFEFQGQVQFADLLVYARDGQMGSYSTLNEIGKVHDNFMYEGCGMFKVCHGDLNSRNVNWSEAHKQYFLIDFEHTGWGFKGLDEFKLITSLVTELRTTGGGEDDFVRNFDDCNRTIDLIVKWITAGLTSTHKSGKSTWLVSAKSVLDGTELNAIGKHVMLLLDKIDLEIGKNGFCPAAFIAYLLVCLALKQLEYSLRPLTQEDFKHFAKVDWKNRNMLLSTIVDSCKDDKFAIPRISTFVLSLCFVARLAEAVGQQRSRNEN